MTIECLQTMGIFSCRLLLSHYGSFMTSSGGSARPNGMAYAHRYLLPSLKLSFVIKAFPVECFSVVRNSFCYHGNIGEKKFTIEQKIHTAHSCVSEGRSNVAVSARVRQTK